MRSGCAALFAPLPRFAARERWEAPCLIALLVIAAIVRFWGVGSFSLHKPDEDTTVLPAVHILVDGTPRFPSGMFYARAISQSYLIAASVKAFGESEWTLRLPSVLGGLLLVVLAYFLGRRFLLPAWNMVFVGVVALLPGLIADSQEARMYIFLSASLATYMILLFRWERTGKTSDLAMVVAAMLVALQFQEIAIFEALLIFFPGLVRNDAAKLRAGLAAFVAMALGYVAISQWILSFYPHDMIVNSLGAVSQFGDAPDPHGVQLIPILVLTATAGAGCVSWWVARTVRDASTALVAGTLVFAGLMLQSAFFIIWPLCFCSQE